MLLSKKKNARFTLFSLITILVNGRESADCPYCTDCGEYNHQPWCNICAKGYYWANGRCYECDKNCNNCSSSNCIQPCETNFGECLSGCKTGYYTYNETETGRIFCRRCTEANCRDCDSDWCTICEDGYFLQHNICVSCNINHCKTCQRLNNCKTCNKGYYGQQCHISCSKGCADNGEFTDLCDRATGECTMGCKPNWRGRLCGVVDGKWGQWTQYGACSKTCGGGIKMRTRACDHPVPAHNGRFCHGVSNKSKTCNTNLCFDGQWSAWQGWSKCSVTCSLGTQKRVRTCDNPAPQNGRTSCPGESYEVKDCQQTECSVDGHWGQWTVYSECLGNNCGNYSRSRNRSCDSPPPSIDGRDCVGQGYEQENCNTEQCQDMSTEESQETTNISNIIVITGAAAGGAVLIIVLIVVTVVLIKRRKKGENRNVDNENANIPNADNEAQNRGMEPEENAYALPNKFRTKRKNEENPIELQRVELAASATDEPPPLSTKTNLYLDESDLEELGPNTIETDNDTGGVPEDYDTYYNTSTFMRWRMTKDALMMKLSDNNIDTFKNEFERLSNGLTRDYKESLKPENRPRNRYKLVYPYDVSRVVITDSISNYINANFIDGYNQPRAYIACLGPTKPTTDNFEQFWRMIWQEDVEKIVMLTNLMEGITMKCEQYWPNTNSGEKYGHITVKNISETTNAEYSIRKFRIKKNQEKRDVTHLHFTAWPDKTVPDDVISILEFRQKVISVPTKLKGPTVVHCSAGIGRTGTYIALDMLIEEGKQEQSVDVFGCVNGIRGQRTNLVQNLPQYMYIHHALIHEMTFGDDSLPLDQFHINISDGQREVLRQQFRGMQQIKPRYLSEEEVAAIKKNTKRQNKNRLGADVPGYRNRVLLRKQRQSGSGGYINAVYIQVNTTGSPYIVAQTPLPNTIEDFLDLAIQENVHSIVSMDPVNVPNQPFGSILPTNDQELTIGPYTIRCHKQNTMDGYICRELEITNSNMGKSILKRTVFTYQCLIWDSGNQTPSSPSTFVKMIKDIETQSSSADSTTLIHCLNAAERSCLYCAVSMLTHKVDSEPGVNVINTVTRLRARRPMAIPNEDQFYFCHECVASYIESSGRLTN